MEEQQIGCLFWSAWRSQIKSRLPNRLSGQDRPHLTHFLHHQISQILQQADISSFKRSRACVDKAQCANTTSVGKNQRTPGIKPDPRFIDYKRVVAESRIL